MNKNLNINISCFLVLRLFVLYHTPSTSPDSSAQTFGADRVDGNRSQRLHQPELDGAGG